MKQAHLETDRPKTHFKAAQNYLVSPHGKMLSDSLDMQKNSKISHILQEDDFLSKLVRRDKVNRTSMDRYPD